jgi:hypothetical protein
MRNDSLNFTVPWRARQGTVFGGVRGEFMQSQTDRRDKIG